jgi:5-hydroxyisourate hydrolase-like protein (transthyretin family)
MTAQAPTPKRTPRAGPRWLTPILILLVVLLAAGGFGALRWIDTLPERVGDQQTVLIAPAQLAPGSTAALRVIVQDYAAGRPIAGADVSISLQPPQGRAIPLYTGQTDASGSLPVVFTVPADAPANATIVVDTSSPAGRDHVMQQVTITREWRLLLSTDKPLYQPGQVIHMRALALSTLDMTPAAGTTVDFLVEDAKGNKVYRQSVVASDYGVAACDFQLASLVNQGNYKLSVAIGETRSEKTVEVRPYVLPKFGVQVSTDKPFYLPGQRVAGTVQVDYFFGKPVAQAEVQIVGSVWDVERTVVVDIRGTADENGTYEFAFDLPDYFAGGALEAGQAQFALEVTVIDQTKHAEQTSQVLPVAAQSLVLSAVAESGTLRPGVENIIYILASYPDGRPAEARLQVSVDGGTPTALESGEFGLAQFAFVPTGAHSLVITAADAAGNTASRELYLDATYEADSILLRADRAAYLVGETMHLVALTSVDAGHVYLDIVKAGQTLSTRSAAVQDGRVEFAVDVSADLYGTLELHAYKVLLDGTIVRDTRLVVVDAPNELTVDIHADRDVYKPGETATISFLTGAATGEGIRAALGLAIVDESVFALQSQDAGFAKLYFVLEQALLQPRYQIKQFELPGQYAPEDVALRQAQDEAARAAWAGAPVTAEQAVNSRPLKQNAVAELQTLAYLRLTQATAAAMILVPLVMLVVAVVALARGRVLGRGLLRLLIATVIIAVGAGLLVLLFAGANILGLNLAWLPLLLGAAFVLGLLFFLIYSIVTRDVVGLFLVLLHLAWGALFYLLLRLVWQVWDIDERLLIAALAAGLLIPPAYLLLGQGRWAQGKRTTGAAVSVVSLVVMFAQLVVPLVAFVGVGQGALLGNAGGWGGDVWLETDGVVMERQAVMVPPGLPAPTPAALPAGAEDKSHAATPPGVEPPRLRQYFPETLFWLPELVTDENGRVSLQVPMADSITTWRLTALASSQDGRLGFNTYGLRVFQDFFVDIDLPVALTVGDEISIPVGVFNYLAEAQEVRLVAQEEAWFELLGPGEQTMTIAANDIDVVYFPIRVKEFGQQGFQVTAWGSQMSDAIRREVNVLPDGKETRLTESNWLQESKEVTVTIPAEAVPGTARIEVKIYPGVLSQVVEGLEKLLQVPYG